MKIRRNSATGDTWHTLSRPLWRLACDTLRSDLAGISRPDDIEAHIRGLAYKPGYTDLS